MVSQAGSITQQHEKARPRSDTLHGAQQRASHREAHVGGCALCSLVGANPTFSATSARCSQCSHSLSRSTILDPGQLRLLGVANRAVGRT